MNFYSSKAINNHFLSRIFIIFYIISSLFVIKPLYSKTIRKELAIQKQCFSNQNKLSGAIFNYNSDNQNVLDTALPGGDFEILEKTLIEHKYLNDYLELPDEKCSYGYLASNIDNPEDIVFCKFHGIVTSKNSDCPTLPEYEMSLEKPFSEEYKDIIAKRNKKKFFNELIKGFLSPEIVGILISIIIFSLFFISFKKSLKKKH